MAGRSSQHTARQIREAKQRIEAFQRRFGAGHLALAYHAAFPAALTPDLLYSLWIVFRHDVHGIELEVEREAVADLLLSRLCAEVGSGLYEIDEVVQVQLRNAMLSNPAFGPQRVQELATFLVEYVRPDLMSDDLTTRELAEAQRLAALAPTDPESALRYLVKLFVQVGPDERDEWIRIARLVDQSTVGQPEFNKIRDYAAGMRHYRYGDLEAATAAFTDLTVDGISVPIAGVPLLVPAVITRRLKKNLPSTPGPATDVNESTRLTQTPGSVAENIAGDLDKEIESSYHAGFTARPLGALFVNRLMELDRFRKSLKGASGRTIILVSAGEGMGKSWLLRRFAQDTEAHGGSHALIDFADNQIYDGPALMGRFRDLLGPGHFSRLTATINESNEATAPRIVIQDQPSESESPAVNIAGAQLGEVSFGDVAGGNIIKDNLFVATDNPLLFQALEDRITQAFFEDLRVMAASRPVVFFFDSYERALQEVDRWGSATADRWIQRELLSRIGAGRLLGVLVVLAGRRLPELDAEWAKVVGSLVLGPLSLADVDEYLRHNRRLSNLSDSELEALYKAIQGNPQLLGLVADNLERSLLGQ